MPGPSLRMAMLGRGLQPQLDVDFRGASLPAGVTATRASLATDGLYTDAPGSSYNTYAIDQPRLLGARGYLNESTRQQRLRNSTAPANHTTFNMGAVTYTFWMIGTGSCEIAPNTAVGTGWGTVTAGNPINILITSTGTADITVSGSVDRFQLESGAWPSSFIENTTTSVIRAADSCFGPWPFQSWRQMSMLGQGALSFNPAINANQWLAQVSNGDAFSVGFGLKRNNSGAGADCQYATEGGGLTAASLVQLQSFQMGSSCDGTVLRGAGVTGGQQILPTGNPSVLTSTPSKNLNSLFYGSLTAASSQQWIGFIQRIRYWDFTITPAQFEVMMRE